MNTVVRTRIAPNASPSNPLIDRFCALVAESVLSVIKTQNPEWLNHERREAMVHSVVNEYVSKPINEKSTTPEGKKLIEHIKKIDATIQENGRLSSSNPIDRQLVAQSVGVVLGVLNIKPKGLVPRKK